MEKVIAKIKELFKIGYGKEYYNEVNKINLENIRLISIVAFIFELYGEIVLLINFSKEEIRSIIFVSACLGVLIICIAASTWMLKNNLHYRITQYFVYTVMLLFIIWGGVVSYSHYINNEQILTFFTVIFVVISVVVMKPIKGLIVIFLAFSLFYNFLYNFDKGAQLNEFNYFTMAIVCIWISFLRYFVTINLLKEKKQVEAFNTQLKNSYIKKELEASNNKIKLMQNQISPHFVFNTLEIIRALILENPDKAVESINNFSVYLRNNIDALGSEELIPFYKELKHIKAFFAIEMIDSPNEIKVIYNIEEENFMIPALTVEPIVENALIHGVRKKRDNKEIQISTKKEDRKYIITVTDNGYGFDTNTIKNGVGINNVIERLKIQCNGKVIIDSNSNGTTVTIIVPEGE